MKLTTIPRTWRHLRRYRQVLGVLLKFGLDDVVDIARKDLVVRFGGQIIPRLKRDINSGMSRAERMRLAAEALGPTFVKMGQILSMRPEIIHPDIAIELQKLQDEVAPIPFEEIKSVIRNELKEEPEKVFAEIIEEPLAAASIAQVHRAKLHSGKSVVLKVQRPDIKAIIDVDMEILADLARILSKHSQGLIAQNPVAIVNEFDRSIHRELDFLQEGRSIQRFGRMFADDSTVFIPAFYPELSSPRLLVMDYMDGIKASNLAEIADAGLDRIVIAKRGARLILRQIFEFGFFHADPHPGNIMVLDENIIAPLDYGMVGHLDEPAIDELGNVLIGVIRKDVRRILRSFEQLGISHGYESSSSLYVDMEDFINRYYEIPLQQLQVSTLLSEIFDIVQKHHLTIPPNLSLMLKALVTVEGLGRTLYPEFDFVSEVRPYLKKVTLHRYDPRRRFRDMLILMEDMYRLVEELPPGIQDILRKVRQGELKVQFEHRNLERLTMEMNRSSSRLAAAVIIGSLIVGSSLVMQVKLGPSLFGFPLLGIIGYLLASVLGLKLIWDIFRSRNS
ncbi:MAG: ubiquinone biosynthesis protein UbiB [Thermoprotei archaeon]|nr:MAG: ubiquinone biosynthesis protein UbiB [Thermoprotei archaeon]